MWWTLPFPVQALIYIAILASSIFAIGWLFSL